jgi:hypothetical protein
MKIKTRRHFAATEAVCLPICYFSEFPKLETKFTLENQLSIRKPGRVQH